MKKIIAILLVISTSLFMCAFYIPTITGNENDYTYSTDDLSKLVDKKLSDSCSISYTWADGILATDSELRNIKVGDCKLRDAAKLMAEYYMSKVRYYSQGNAGDLPPWHDCELFNPPRKVRADCSGYAYATLALYLNSEFCVSMAGVDIQAYTGSLKDQLMKIDKAPDKLKILDSFDSNDDIPKADFFIVNQGHTQYCIEYKEDKTIEDQQMKVFDTFGWGIDGCEKRDAAGNVTEAMKKKWPYEDYSLWTYKTFVLSGNLVDMQKNERDAWLSKTSHTYDDFKTYLIIAKGN